MAENQMTLRGNRVAHVGCDCDMHQSWWSFSLGFCLPAPKMCNICLN